MSEIGRKYKVLLNAHQKTGQHWLLFVLANYHKILTENAQKGILFRETSYSRFGLADCDIDEITERGIEFSDFDEGFPTLKRTEAIWNNIWFKRSYCKLHESFDKVIYLYRNPFDVMISLLHWHKLEMKDLEDLVKKRLPYYIRHLNEGIPHANVLLRYEDLRKDPNGFKKALLLFYDEINENVFKKSLEMSSFEAIHKINPFHARNGRVGQYLKIMSEELIQYIRIECNEGGLNV